MYDVWTNDYEDRVFLLLCNYTAHMGNAYLHEPISHDVLVKLTVFPDNHIEDRDDVHLHKLISCVWLEDPILKLYIHTGHTDNVISRLFFHILEQLIVWYQYHHWKMFQPNPHCNCQFQMGKKFKISVSRFSEINHRMES